jgi:two-component system, LytTR family, response regulator
VTIIRTLVADDEPIARAHVIALLRDEPDIEVVAECCNGSEAAAAIGQTSPDLLFLDIQMPELDGFELIRAVGTGRAPAVVFVTAYDEYALRAFEVRALDYLLKPFSVDRFRSALAHARAQLSHRHATTIGRQLLDLLPSITRPAPHRDRLVVKSSGRIYFVRITDIDWCEAAGNYVRLHVGSQTHLVRDTMAHVESDLDPTQFVRIHRSAIVNVDRIQELQSSFGGEYIVLLRDGTRLTLSRGYREGLQARLGKSL